jgi:hypothetical protein
METKEHRDGSLIKQQMLRTNQCVSVYCPYYRSLGQNSSISDILLIVCPKDNCICNLSSDRILPPLPTSLLSKSA